MFKVKNDGTYRARFVALGYSQVPGVDHFEQYAPVINDVTFHIIFTLAVKNGWVMEVEDVERAFLHGKLEEEIFMKPPEGLSKMYEEMASDEMMQIEEDDLACELKYALYGLVQADHSFFKKLKEILVQFGYIQCKSDVCLFIRKDECGFVGICIYVDDCCIVGDESAVEKVLLQLEGSEFGIKRVGTLKEYVGCQIRRSEKGLMINQSRLISKMEDKFEDEIKKHRMVTMPAIGGMKIIRPIDDGPKLCDDDQTRFRSGVGMLLYLVKISQLDMANITRELSKVMDGANDLHMKHLIRAIKYVIETRTKYLQIMPSKSNDEWKLVGMSDSDYTGDRESRISITGFVIYFEGVLISWK